MDPTYALCSPNPEFKPGRISIYLHSADRLLNVTEKSFLEYEVEDAYNTASGGCLDLYERYLQNATLVNQYFEENTNAFPLLKTEWLTYVRCKSCPDKEPMFGKLEDGNMRQRRMQTKTANNYKEFLSELGSRIAKGYLHRAVMETKQVLRLPQFSKPPRKVYREKSRES
jgi:hypothetical protein